MNCKLFTTAVPPLPAILSPGHAPSSEAMTESFP